MRTCSFLNFVKILFNSHVINILQSKEKFACKCNTNAIILTGLTSYKCTSCPLSSNRYIYVHFEIFDHAYF